MHRARWTREVCGHGHFCSLQWYEIGTSTLCGYAVAEVRGHRYLDVHERPYGDRGEMAMATLRRAVARLVINTSYAVPFFPEQCTRRRAAVVTYRLPDERYAGPPLSPCKTRRVCITPLL